MKKFLTGCIIGFLTSDVLNKISFSIICNEADKGYDKDSKIGRRIEPRTKVQDSIIIANRYFARIDSYYYVEVDEKVYEDTKNNTDLPIIHSVLSNEDNEKIHY